MKTIGLIGGMSWESSLEYYRIINEAVKQKLGGLHSAQCLLYSVDFAEIEVMQQESRWHDAAQALIQVANNLENGGADFLVLCTNTMHKVFEELQANARIPILHIADATGQKIREAVIQRIGLLGTRFTMEEDFYKARLQRKYGLDVYIPPASARAIVHQVIYQELVLGEINQNSKDQYLRIIRDLVAEGVKGVILGCTEIGLLVHDGDCEVPLFDTTRIHAEAAVEFALGNEYVI